MMYTITRGPSKLVTQRRTGQTQQIDKINDFKHKQTPWSIPDSPAPKIVFNRLNGKKYHHTPAALLQVDLQPKEGFTSAHQENVKFIYEAWQEVVQLAEEGGASEEKGSASAQGPVQYSDTNPSPNPALQNFVPIDLDEWWAQRFLANIDNLS
ncbi:MAPK regulated corepressor interacting protein 2-like [Oncorhynchus keta]|uniref:MAPK regulated corepressor interacting protein 2-like n=1 Tax=Oncorhynchus keta TaxID=8018 RepID=UPI00227C9F8F|nr:MAPK regulated corepressor interacting protein 2-like [Oncorhynchus keta]